MHSSATFASKNHDSFLTSLKREFVSRCHKNPAYSLRAFALFLNIDQSLLSKIMRSKRAVSKKNQALISSRLGILINSDKRRKKSEDRFLPLLNDEFEVISEWYHFAILELSKTKDFRPQPNLIARRLGLHVEEVRTAIERLQRLGLIRFVDGTFSLNSADNTWSNTQSTSDARRLLQKKLLGRGIDAIETVPFQMRENGSLTVAISKKRILEFKERLTEMRRELGEFFQADQDFDEVYQLTVSFFPLTKLTEGHS